MLRLPDKSDDEQTTNPVFNDCQLHPAAGNKIVRLNVLVDGLDEPDAHQPGLWTGRRSMQSDISGLRPGALEIFLK
jgi:hypothetical protein